MHEWPPRVKLEEPVSPVACNAPFSLSCTEHGYLWGKKRTKNRALAERGITWLCAVSLSAFGMWLAVYLWLQDVRCSPPCCCCSWRERFSVLHLFWKCHKLWATLWLRAGDARTSGSLLCLTAFLWLAEQGTHGTNSTNGFSFPSIIPFRAVVGSIWQEEAVCHNSPHVPSVDLLHYFSALWGESEGMWKLINNCSQFWVSYIRCWL